MAAYVIAEMNVIDEGLAVQYAALAAPVLKAFGGRHLVRGAKPDVREGTRTHQRIVIIEFPSMENALAWYTSPQYASAHELGLKALDRRLTFVEGLPPEV
jgi:uncharacterized protein (DUF1330 family)